MNNKTSIDKNDNSDEEEEEEEKCRDKNRKYLEMDKEFAKLKIKNAGSPNEEEWNYIKKMYLVRKFNDSQNQRVKEQSLNFDLYEGEEIIFQDTCFYILKNTNYVEGTIFVSNYRVNFIAKTYDIYEKEFLNVNYMNVMYPFINYINRKKDKNSKNYYWIKFVPRDRPLFYLAFSNKKNTELIEKIINESVSANDIKNFYAFKYFNKFEKNQNSNNSNFTNSLNNNSYENFDNINGWNIYEYFFEYMRMGVDLDNNDTKYRLYIQDMEGIICETYPNFIYTLKAITDDELNKCAKFRTKKRFPALTWSSKNNRGTLWRSSQNKTGVIQKRCTEDEKLLNYLQKTTQKLHIYDARPYLNALANKMKGAGFENSLNYVNSHVFFCDIDNIHAVRDSFEKVKTLSQLNLEGYTNFFYDFSQTGWFYILSKIIKASVNISISLLENSTVLVHCSDGWDRTSQLVSLAQIIVDPYFRTIKGFAVLVEKDWLSFGHQFAIRCGHDIKKKKKDENSISPIFLQFLDCVHQFLYQFPEMFEFNGNILLFMSYHIYSCVYGSFLVNNERDKAESYIKLKTVSIWTDIFSHKHLFINKSFNEVRSNNTILTPSCAMYKLRFWEEYFLRWNPEYNMKNEVFNSYHF